MPHRPPPPRHPDANLDVTFGSADGVAVTTHHLATRTAVQMLESGGNAVDAAIAANAVLGVVAPDTCGPGGDLFALVHEPGATAPTALNASGCAGSGVDATRMRQRGLTAMPLRSPETVTVPGCVDGWEALLGRHGSRSLGEVLAPAMALANDGFEVSTELATTLAYVGALIGAEVSAEALYPDGAPPRPGDIIRRPDLATTLAEIADGGRRAFYEGRAGSGITAATDNQITAADLAQVQADWVTPIGVTLHGLEAWTMPPNSQGYLTLAALWLADAVALGSDPEDPATHHGLIEAYRAVAWERDDLVTDPGTSPLPQDRLLDPERLGRRVSVIDDRRVADWPAPSPAPGGTAYLCTRDRWGMGVSLIQSNFHGIGAGLGAGDTGVFLHNRGAGFNLIPGHPNELSPGRRPLHTLSPTLWTDAGALRLLLGTRGGHYQPQILLQVAAHRFAAGLSLTEAIAAPRWVLDSVSPDEPPSLLVEGRMPSTVIDGLRGRGHLVSLTGDWQRDWGPVAAIEVTDDGGTASGDPRVDTSTAATI